MNVAVPTETTTILSLCSGIGGLDIGVARALRKLGKRPRTKCYVEGEAFAVAVLAKAMLGRKLDEAPVWSDLFTFDGRPWRGTDLCISGLPCQPFSVAGKAGASKDPRHLWPEMRRVLEEARPRFVFFENVPGLVRRGLREIVEDLSEIGFSQIEWDCFSAEETGAPHRRDRLFLLAHADRSEIRNGTKWKSRRHEDSVQAAGQAEPGNNGLEGAMADPHCRGLEEQRLAQPQGQQSPRRGEPDRRGPVRQQQHSSGASEGHPWETGSGVRRMADGVRDRVLRLRVLGNAVVPQTAELAFLELYERMFSTD